MPQPELSAAMSSVGTSVHRCRALAFQARGKSSVRPRSKGTACAASRRDALLTATALLATAATAPEATAAAMGPELISQAREPLAIMTSGQLDAAITVAKKVVTKTKAPLLLRLFFHDAFTYRAKTDDGGPNASIQFELDRPENAGLKRGWSTVQEAKRQLKGTDGADLTEADLVVVLAAAAVYACGGPTMTVFVGRDTAKTADPEGRMPREDFTAEQLQDFFAAADFNTQELVVLSGAHTLGSKGFGDPAKFDTAYFDALMKQPWNDPTNKMAPMIGLPSDHALAESKECMKYIEQYAKDEKLFHQDFADAFTRLANRGYLA